MTRKGNESPIFPSEAFSAVDSTLNLPENQIISSGSLSLSIVLAEPVLYLRGFSPEEYMEKPPTMLRGSLIVRVLKQTKIKSIELTFKGIARTEWPEGIPPKKAETSESHEIYHHQWPFFMAGVGMSTYSSGANMIKLHKDGHVAWERTHPTNDSSSSLNSIFGIHRETMGHRRNNSGPDIASSSQSVEQRRPRSGTESSDTSERSAKGVRALAGKLRRAASPGPSFSKEPFLHTLNLAPRRSFSKEEPVDLDTSSKGYRSFEPGEYYYNFELPLPQSIPESMEANFGSVHYTLEASVERPGAFRNKVTGTKEVILVRCPADNNIEVNEPIAIQKQWEDQLDYEIVISGKAFPIGTKIPMAFKLTPLAKISLHRIRVFITENNEYYCNHKRVHRIEPTRRFLIEEKLSKEGMQGNLLTELASGIEVNGDTILSSAELELDSLIPETFPKKKDILHPNSTYELIQINHWIKIVLRISRPDPTPNAEPGKRKHYEISIDSPIHLLDKKCTNANVYLPEYIDPVSRRASTATHRAIPAGSQAEPRPIHFLRKPSIAPPPFNADTPPPPEDPDAPPDYTIATQDESDSYFERFQKYKLQREKSHEEREMKRKAESQRRPSTIIEGHPTSQGRSQRVGPSSSAAAVVAASSASSISFASAVRAQPSDLGSSVSLSSTNSGASSSSGSTSMLNTSMFASSSRATNTSNSMSPAAPSTFLNSSQARNGSLVSVDITDQSIEADSEDPLSPSIRAQSTIPQTSSSSSNSGLFTSSQFPQSPRSSRPTTTSTGVDTESDIDPLVSPSSSVSETADPDELMPKLYLNSSIDGTPLLQADSSRPRLESTTDLGMYNADEDQASVASMNSLWIT